MHDHIDREDEPCEARERVLVARAVAERPRVDRDLLHAVDRLELRRERRRERERERRVVD